MVQPMGSDEHVLECHSRYCESRGDKERFDLLVSSLSFHGAGQFIHSLKDVPLADTLDQLRGMISLIELTQVLPMP